jgi:hypothetical protein
VVAFPFLTAATFSSSVLRAVLASLLSVPSPNISVTPEFGSPGSPVHVTVVAVVTPVLSAGVRDVLEHVVQEGVLVQRLLAQLNGASYGSATLAAVPLRRPNAASPGNTIGLATTLAPAGVQLTWQQFASAPGSPSRFVIEAAPRVSSAAATVLADYMLATGLGGTSSTAAARFQRAQAGLQAIMPQQQMAVDGKGETTAFVRACEVVRGGILVKHDSDCLHPDQPYHVRIRGTASLPPPQPSCTCHRPCLIDFGLLFFSRV